MDPDAVICRLARAIDEMVNGENGPLDGFNEAIEALEELDGWLVKGGFKPTYILVALPPGSGVITPENVDPEEVEEGLVSIVGPAQNDPIEDRDQ